MHQAVGTKKLGDDQKAKAFVGHESGKRQEEQFYDPAQRKVIQVKTQIRRGLWEEHFKSPGKELDEVSALLLHCQHAF